MNDNRTTINWDKLRDPVILRGDKRTAYRDAAAHYHRGTFRIYHSVTTLKDDGALVFQVGMTKSADLINWTEPVIVSPENTDTNFGDPGNVIRFRDRWIMCLESYPCPPTGNSWDARIYTMESDDLESWSEPELLMVKGPNLPEKEMGRVIGPYLFKDKDDDKKWWCFFKHGGIVIHQPKNLAFGGSDLPPSSILMQSLHMSFSYDLKNWVYYGCTNSEENYCVLVDNDEYVLIDSPGNGVGVKLSKDLINWSEVGLFTFGQRRWPWAQGRLTAGHVLDLRNLPEVGKFFMVFHGCSVEGKLRSNVHGEACLAIAWSDDLQRWYWPE